MVCNAHLFLKIRSNKLNLYGNNKKQIMVKVLQTLQCTITCINHSENYIQNSVLSERDHEIKF